MIKCGIDPVWDTNFPRGLGLTQLSPGSHLVKKFVCYNLFKNEFRDEKFFKLLGWKELLEIEIGWKLQSHAVQKPVRKNPKQPQ